MAIYLSYFGCWTTVGTHRFPESDENGKGRKKKVFNFVYKIMRLSFLINDKNGKLNFEKSLCKNFLAKKKSGIPLFFFPKKDLEKFSKIFFLKKSIFSGIFIFLAGIFFFGWGFCVIGWRISLKIWVRPAGIFFSGISLDFQREIKISAKFQRGKLKSRWNN